MKYNKLNIIGDIHGRPCWKELVQDDAINIFLGDYLDSREVIFTQNELVNFLEILHYKKEHPENVILLIANHDIKYMFGHDNPHYYNIFYEYRNVFDGVAYAHGDYLITHAGVSKEWYQRYFTSDEQIFPWGEVRLCRESDPIYHPSQLIIKYK